MRMIAGTRGTIAVAALACMLVSACASGPSGRVASIPAVHVSVAGDIDAVVALLEDGNTASAKKRISAGLRKDPNNPSLMLLRDSISRKPEELLGPESYRYTVRSGDTMAGLAQRFLGNRLKFYQLARYNGMDRPVSLRAGQRLEIPGRLAPPPSPSVERRLPSAEAVAPREKPKAALSPATPNRRAGDPTAARQARSAGLAALNSGQPGQAVTLLARAASLDPGNPVIAQDLARARRIAATVGAR